MGHSKTVIFKLQGHEGKGGQSGKLTLNQQIATFTPAAFTYRKTHDFLGECSTAYESIERDIRGYRVRRADFLYIFH